MLESGNGFGDSHPANGSGNGSSGSPVSVLLILEDDGNRQATRAALEGLPGVEVVGERSELRAGLLLARQLHPRVILLDLPENYEEALSAAGNYKLDSPDTALFLLCNTLDPQVLLKAIRAGAQEVLKKPLDRAVLQEAVERVSRSGAARSAGGTRTRSILTVFSAKGGLGATTVAANLAVCLRAELGVETVLADFDHQSGDAAHVLGLKAERSMAELVRAPRIDTATLHMNLLHHPTGVAVLAQPEDLKQLEYVSPAQAGAMLEALSSSFDAVVIDAPHTVDEVSLEILDRSTVILFVLELSVPSIRAARRALDVLERLHYTEVPGRVRLVVNRYGGARGFLSLDDVSETLGSRPFHTIENDYGRVSAAVNAGRPVCIDSPDTPVARDISSLAAKLLDRKATHRPGPVIRRGLFGRKVAR